MLALQLAERVPQEAGRDVDGDVARRLEQRKEPRRLGAVARAEVDQRHPGAAGAGDGLGMGGDDRALGAGRVVLVELGDGLEQVRTQAVVEVLGLEAGGRSREKGDGVGALVRRGRRSVGPRAAGSAVAAGRRTRAERSWASTVTRLPRWRPLHPESTHDAPFGCATPGSRHRARRCLLGAARPAAAASSPEKPSHVLKPWDPARPVPELDLLDLDGRRHRLAPLADRVVLLNFWATWCEPCRAEMPSLSNLALREIASGLVVLAVNYKEPAEKIRHFLKANPFRPPVLLDTDGDCSIAWTPKVFPTTVVIGRGARPVTSVIGDLDWTGPVARSLLDPLLAKRHG
jgi:thiol-disulfide isomerase/thioredoxin